MHLRPPAGRKRRKGRRGASQVASPSTPVGTVRIDTDRAVAAAAIAGYAAAVVLLMPASAFAHMLGGGLLFFLAIGGVSRLLGGRRTPPFSIFLVSVVGIAVLLMPNFAAMGGEHFVGVPVGFAGSQAGALLWTTLRWRADPEPKLPVPLRVALLAGAGFAAALGAIAAIPIVLILLDGEPGASAILWVYPAYLAGGLGIGTVYWMLQGLAHRPVGRFLAGGLGGFCLYAAMGPVIAVVDGDPMDLGMIVAVGLVGGFLVGPTVAMTWNEQWSA